MRRILFALVLALASSGSAQAKPLSPPTSPPWPLDALFDDEEIRLADSYRVLMGHLGPAAQASLRTSQRRWIQSKNRACGFEKRNRCALRLTVARNKELETMITRQTAWRHWPDGRLIKLEGSANYTCKAFAQEPEGAICRRRDQLSDELERRGWCWGPDKAVEVDRHWMRPGRRCKPYYGH